MKLLSLKSHRSVVLDLWIGQSVTKSPVQLICICQKTAVETSKAQLVGGKFNRGEIILIGGSHNFFNLVLFVTAIVALEVDFNTQRVRPIFWFGFDTLQWINGGHKKFKRLECKCLNSIRLMWSMFIKIKVLKITL